MVDMYTYTWLYVVVSHSEGACPEFIRDGQWKKRTIGDYAEAN